MSHPQWYALMRVRVIEASDLGKVPLPRYVLAPMHTTIAADSDGRDHTGTSHQLTLAVRRLSRSDLRVDREVTREEAIQVWREMRRGLVFLGDIPDSTLQTAGRLIPGGDDAEEVRLAISRALTQHGAAPTANGFAWDAIRDAVIKALDEHAAGQIRARHDEAQWRAVAAAIGSTNAEPRIVVEKLREFVTFHAQVCGQLRDASATIREFREASMIDVPDLSAITPAHLRQRVVTLRKQPLYLEAVAGELDLARDASLTAVLERIRAKRREAQERSQTIAAQRQDLEAIARAMGMEPEVVEESTSASQTTPNLEYRWPTAVQMIARARVLRDAAEGQISEVCTILGAPPASLLSVAQDRMTEIQRGRALEGELREVLGAGEGESTLDAARGLRQQVSEMGEEMARGADPEKLGAAVGSLVGEPAEEPEPGSQAELAAVLEGAGRSPTLAPDFTGRLQAFQAIAGKLGVPASEPDRVLGAVEVLLEHECPDAVAAPVKCRGCGEVRATSCGAADCPVPLQVRGDLETPEQDLEAVARAHARVTRLRAALAPLVPSSVLETLIDAILTALPAESAGAPTPAVEHLFDWSDPVAAIEHLFGWPRAARRSWTAMLAGLDVLWSGAPPAVQDAAERASLEMSALDPFEEHEREIDEFDEDAVARIEERAAEIVAERILMGRS